MVIFPIIHALLNLEIGANSSSPLAPIGCTLHFAKRHPFFPAQRHRFHELSNINEMSIFPTSMTSILIVLLTLSSAVEMEACNPPCTGNKVCQNFSGDPECVCADGFSGEDNCTGI